MVEDRVTDGRRIGQLLASEIRGRQRGPLGSLAVVEVRDVEGSTDGEFAYGIALDGERLADVFVHENRARVEFRAELEAAAAAGEREGLRVRRKDTGARRTLVFVASGAEVKRAVDVLEAVVEGAGGDARDDV